MASDQDGFLVELYSLAKNLGPGWRQALQEILQARIRPHEAEMKKFAQEVASIAEVSPTTGDQLDFGGTTKSLDGVVVGFAFVSAGTPDHKVWIEDWVIKNDVGFLTMRPGPCVLEFGGAYGTGPDAALIALTTGTQAAKAWRSTQVGSYISAKNIPTAPSITVDEFDLVRAGVTLGHLLREVYTQGGETWVDDHWVLRGGYTAPAAGAPVSVVFKSATTNLMTRLGELKVEANLPGTNQPKNYTFMSARLREYPPQ